MNTPATRWLILISATLIACQNAKAGIMNGDFSDTTIPVFTDWTTEPDIFVDPIAPTNDANRASFIVDGYDSDSTDPNTGVVQLQQIFTLPSGATTLSFEYLMTTTGGGVFDPFLAAPPYDIFQASLLDSTTLAPVISINGFDDRFFGIDALGNMFKANEVDPPELLASGFRRVVLDLTSVPAQELLLDFRLLGDDDGLITTVLLDNVSVGHATGVVPEPATMAIWGVFGTATMGLRRKRRVFRSVRRCGE